MMKYLAVGSFMIRFGLSIISDNRILGTMSFWIRHFYEALILLSIVIITRPFYHSNTEIHNIFDFFVVQQSCLLLS